ncbi:MAG: hypothetical protein LBI47_03015 [Puniceicoccales bacterium]|nr:hypothetical protein [Puniceicoccales bacterium]
MTTPQSPSLDTSSSQLPSKFTPSNELVNDLLVLWGDGTDHTLNNHTANIFFDEFFKWGGIREVVMDHIDHHAV